MAALDEEATNSRCPEASSESSSEHTDNETQRISVRLVLLFIAMSIAITCGGLDANLVAPAVPAMTNSLGGAKYEGWYGSVYYLALSCCQMAWSQIYKAFPSKPVFFGAFIVFELGALVGALAPNSIAVILGRALSGAGISGTFVGALIIVSYIVPLRWRPIMGAFFSVLIGSTQTAGPVLGGALTTRLSWRWCFWINLPIGGTALLLALLGGNISEPESCRGGKSVKQLVQNFDIIGFAFWVAAVICLTLLMQFGGTQYSWTSWQLVVLYVMTTFLFVQFGIVQWRYGDTALVPGRIIKQRSMASSALYMLLLMAAKSQLAYYLPIYFQAVLDDTALQSGLHTIPSFLANVITQILAGLVMSWIGYYTPMMIIGSLLGVAGTALLSTMSLSTSTSRWIGYQILAASGIAIGFNGPQMAAQTVFQDPLDTPTALTIITTCQDLGGSIGTSIGGAVLQNIVSAELQHVLPGMTATQISEAGITGLKNLVSASQRPLVAQAYAKGVQTVFRGSAAMIAATVLLACLVEWRSIKGKTSKKVANGSQSEKV